MRPALRRGPGNPTTPRCKRQCRRRKSRCARPAVFRTRKMPQLATHRRARSPQMLPRHPPVPDRPCRTARAGPPVPDLPHRRSQDEEERERPNSSRSRGNDPRRRNGPEPTVRLYLPSGAQETLSGRRAHRGGGAKHLKASASLRMAPAIESTEICAQTLHERRPVQPSICRNNQGSVVKRRTPTWTPQALHLPGARRNRLQSTSNASRLGQGQR